MNPPIAFSSFLVLLLLTGSGARAQFCDYNNVVYNGTTSGNKPWPQDFNLTDVAPCTLNESYIRPDIGGALQPWDLTAFMLLLQIPLFIVRVVKFDKAQLFSILIASLSVAFTIQAFVSTKFDAAKILVWMPITSVIDAGNMLHIAILVDEENRERRESRRRFSSYTTEGVPLLPSQVNVLSPELSQQPSRESIRTMASNPSIKTDNNNHLHRAVLIITSFLFVGIVAIQIVGLLFAIKNRLSNPFSVLNCSPAFVGFALQTNNCTVYSVIAELSKGISCVALPGTKQDRWLTITITVLFIALLCEAVDFAILRILMMKKSMHDHLWKRPMLTFVCGLVILVVLLMQGVNDTGTLPDGITPQVLIANNITTADGGSLDFICKATLTGPGLRGNALEWMDGLFNSWGCNYYSC